MIAQEYISDMRRLRQSLRSGEVLLVDDEVSINEILFSLCKSVGEKARKVTTIEEAKLQILMDASNIKMAIIDYSINGCYADELIQLCQDYHIPCVIHTARSDLLHKLEERYPDIVIILKPSPIERILKEIL